MKRQSRPILSPVEFIDRVFKRDENGESFSLTPYQRRVPRNGGSTRSRVARVFAVMYLSRSRVAVSELVSRSQNGVESARGLLFPEARQHRAFTGSAGHDPQQRWRERSGICAGAQRYEPSFVTLRGIFITDVARCGAFECTAPG